MGFPKRNSSSKSKKNGGSGGGGRKAPKKDDSNKNIGTSSRPSDLRRERLRKNCDFIQTTTLNNLVPIQRYFSIAVRVSLYMNSLSEKRVSFRLMTRGIYLSSTYLFQVSIAFLTVLQRSLLFLCTLTALRKGKKSL